MHNDMSNFNRQIQNAAAIALAQHGGEAHGRLWKIADLIASEMYGPAEPHDISLMKQHMLAVGIEHLFEGSPVVCFRGGDDDYSLVDRRLLNE